MTLNLAAARAELAGFARNLAEIDPKNLSTVNRKKYHTTQRKLRALRQKFGLVPAPIVPRRCSGPLPRTRRRRHMLRSRRNAASAVKAVADPDPLGTGNECAAGRLLPTAYVSRSRLGNRKRDDDGRNVGFQQAMRNPVVASPGQRCATCRAA